MCAWMKGDNEQWIRATEFQQLYVLPVNAISLYDVMYPPHCTYTVTRENAGLSGLSPSCAFSCLWATHERQKLKRWGFALILMLGESADRGFTGNRELVYQENGYV